MTNHAIFRSTGESIVREHREEMLRRARMRDFNERRIEERPRIEDRGSRIGKQSRGGPLWPPMSPSFLKLINWERVLEYACWGVVIACLFYLGVVIIAPFSIKHL